MLLSLASTRKPPFAAVTSTLTCPARVKSRALTKSGTWNEVASVHCHSRQKRASNCILMCDSTETLRGDLASCCTQVWALAVTEDASGSKECVGRLRLSLENTASGLWLAVGALKPSSTQGGCPSTPCGLFEAVVGDSYES